MLMYDNHSFSSLLYKYFPLFLFIDVFQMVIHTSIFLLAQNVSPEFMNEFPVQSCGGMDRQQFRKRRAVVSNLIKRSLT